LDIILRAYFKDFAICNLSEKSRWIRSFEIPEPPFSVHNFKGFMKKEKLLQISLGQFLNDIPYRYNRTMQYTSILAILHLEFFSFSNVDVDLEDLKGDVKKLKSIKQ